jgi:hypothetical protein
MMLATTYNTESRSEDEMTGHAHHDLRGNAYWQLSSASEAHDLESTTVVLRKLAMPALALHEAPAAPKRAYGYDAHGGCSPYDRVGRRA